LLGIVSVLCEVFSASAAFDEVGAAWLYTELQW
jgi:hypothetical protein